MFLKTYSILYLGVWGLIMSRIKDILKRANPVLCVCNSIYINYISRSQNLLTSNNDSDANYIVALVDHFTANRSRMDYSSLWHLIRVYRLLENLFCDKKNPKNKNPNPQKTTTTKTQPKPKKTKKPPFSINAPHLLLKHCCLIHNGTLMQIYLGLNPLLLNISTSVITILSDSIKDVY